MTAPQDPSAPMGKARPYFVARARDNDTVDVWAPDGVLWLTFTCDTRTEGGVADEETCWLVVARTQGNRAALSFLIEAWPNLDAWGDAPRSIPELFVYFVQPVRSDVS